MKNLGLSIVTVSKLSTKTLMLLSLVCGLSASAADAPPKASQKPSDSQAMGPILENVLNNIQKAQIDFEFSGSVDDKGVNTDLLNVGGLIQFKENISQPIKLSEDKPNQTDAQKKSQAESDKSMAPLLPNLFLGLKGLVVEAQYTEQQKTAKASIRFYSGYDKTKSAWTAKPLVATLSNKLNSNLLTIRLHSLEFSQKPDLKNEDRTFISGSCKSDKQILDIATGELVVKPVLCKFDGFVGKDNKYKINFKYVNQ